MGELWDLDMQRAPVAMTPFCTADANEATRGFRFWEAGFWKGALGERPYHISALFVVDLVRFRSQAAIVDRSIDRSIDREIDREMDRSIGR